MPAPNDGISAAKRSCVGMWRTCCDALEHDRREVKQHAPERYFNTESGSEAIYAESSGLCAGEHPSERRSDRQQATAGTVRQSYSAQKQLTTCGTCEKGGCRWIQRHPPLLFHLPARSLPCSPFSLQSFRGMLRASTRTLPVRSCMPSTSPHTQETGDSTKQESRVTSSWPTPLPL